MTSPRSSAPDPQADPAATEIAACADRLTALTQRSHAFFQQQLDRLEAVAAELEVAPPPTVDVSELQQEFDQQRAAWEQQRAAQEADIDAQLQQLTAAWVQLENEQRRLLIHGQNPAAVAPTPDPSHATPANPGTAHLDLVDTSGQHSSSAAIQFQKLKREIRQHSRRPR